MPLIHHPELKRELDVSEQQAATFTTVPRSPWRLGPLPTVKPPANKPTATSSSPEGDTDPLIEED